jgi:hypothetical protein
VPDAEVRGPEGLPEDPLTARRSDAVSRRSWRTFGAVDLVIAADPQAVYELVSDVTRIGERSPECRSARWESGEPAAVGSVFRGRNRVGWAARWSRRCEVTAAQPGRMFAFRTLPESLDLTRRDSTTWRYDIEAIEGGSRVRHSYEITRLPLRPFLAVYGVLLPQHRDMRPQMRDNLARLAEQLSGAPDPRRSAGAP